MSTLRNLVIALTLLVAGAALAVEPVNINTADAETLASVISGAGTKRAEAIVEYRQQHGPFRSVDELVNVQGIGPKTVEKNRAKLAVE
ncbi:MAG: hypothetical protein GWN09_08535 [Gammaproteobacteria bacterium]|nr:hypothetical protein [Gammaproteobacteria bacterium]